MWCQPFLFNDSFVTMRDKLYFEMRFLGILLFDVNEIKMARKPRMKLKENLMGCTVKVKPEKKI